MLLKTSLTFSFHLFIICNHHMLDDLIICLSYKFNIIIYLHGKLSFYSKWEFS